MSMLETVDLHTSAIMFLSRKRKVRMLEKFFKKIAEKIAAYSRSTSENSFITFSIMTVD